jgi:hypothetical protein
LDNISTEVSNLATMISDMGGASVFLGGIVDNFAMAFTGLGSLTSNIFAENIPADIFHPLFDIPTQLVLFGSNVFDALTGMPVGGDPAAAVSDLSALPAASAQSIESMIQTLLIEVGGTNGTLADLGFNLLGADFAQAFVEPFIAVEDVLGAIGSSIGDISPVFEPIDNIFFDLGFAVFNTGSLLAQLPIQTYTVAVEPLAFGNFQQLVELGSFLIDGGSSSAADAAGLPDVGAGLAADLSALAPGLAADVSGLTADLGSLLSF